MHVKNTLTSVLLSMAKSIGRPTYGFYVYFGVPGSGKTTFAAWIARKALKKEGRVWSNVPIKGTMKLDPESDIGKVMIRGGHLIIDEAGIEYNNRSFKTFSKEATRFYKHHRHYKVTVHLFSQGFDDMDKKLRTLATSLYVVKKSLIPFFVRRYRIAKKVGINELTKEICDEYYKAPLSTRWIFSPPLWHMFDTHSIDDLPEKEWEEWQGAGGQPPPDYGSILGLARNQDQDQNRDQDQNQDEDGNQNKKTKKRRWNGR